MRPSSGFLCLAASTAAGFFLGALILVPANPGLAQGNTGALSAVELPPAANGGGNHNGNSSTNSSSGSCSCPNSAPSEPLDRQKLWPKPSLAELKSTLDQSDAVATLEALQLALTEVGDGATYVWHRKHGRLSGAIQPTSSFKGASGQVCRHIVIALTSGSYTRKSEGIACRQDSGAWRLDG